MGLYCNDDRYNVTFMIMTYFVPMIAMCYTYSRVGVELWGSRAIGEATLAQTENIKSKRKVGGNRLYDMFKVICVPALIKTASWWAELAANTINLARVKCSRRDRPTREVKRKMERLKLKFLLKGSIFNLFHWSLL